MTYNFRKVWYDSDSGTIMSREIPPEEFWKDGDGVTLYNAPHPRPPWWKRPWSWLRCRLFAADVSEESLETIEIQLPDDTQ